MLGIPIKNISNAVWSLIYGVSKKGTSLLVDSNQRLNDQGFIDLEQPQIFYTSIFQHKSKPHISKRDFKLDAKQNSCFYRKYSSEKSFQEMGGRAFGPPQAQALAPHFLKYIFGRIFSVKAWILFWIQFEVAFRNIWFWLLTTTFFEIAEPPKRWLCTSKKWWLRHQPWCFKLRKYA